MDPILCQDFYEEPGDPLPDIITRTNPDAISGRHAAFVYSMDLSPSSGDEELGNVLGAWSLWDIPTAHVSQIDDDRGDDLICLSIGRRIYYLDPNANRDETLWNVYHSIYRLLRIGPIPSDNQVRGYDLSMLKRFREFDFALKDAPQSGLLSRWRVTVSEWDRGAQSTRTTLRSTSQRMRTKIASKGKAFIVSLQHTANDIVRIESWRAVWDEIGRRFRQTKVTP